MLFDYFYGSETEQFTFYRIPKLLITSEYFKKISDSAKILYGLMLDRMSLSLKNNWVDENNKAYIYFTTEDVMEMMCCGTQKATKLLAELDSIKGIGLIERKKQGQGKPAKVYVKKFFAEDMPREAPKKSFEKAVETSICPKNNDCELNKPDQLAKGEVCPSSDDEIVNIQFAEERKEQLSECDSQNEKMSVNYEEISNTNSFITSKEKVVKSEKFYVNRNTAESQVNVTIGDDYNENLEKVKEQIDYELMIMENDKELVDEAVEIMAEVLTVPREYSIEGIKYPYSIVKKRFENVGYEKISAFFVKFNRYATEIRNVKSYLITSLFNACSTSALWMKNNINSNRRGACSAC